MVFLLKIFLTFLRKVFCFIICIVSLWLTWCFHTYSGFYNWLVKILLTVLNVAVMFAQIYNFGNSSRMAHIFWVTEYTLFTVFLHNHLDETVFAGLLDNAITRKFYQPSVEDRHLALICMSAVCVIIVTVSYLANCAIDKYLLRPEEQPQPDVEAVEGDRPQKSLSSVLKEMYHDASKMLTMPFSTAALKNLLKAVNDSYKKVIDKAIVDIEKDFVMTETTIHVVTESLKSLNDCYKNAIAEPINKY